MGEGSCQVGKRQAGCFGMGEGEDEAVVYVPVLQKSLYNVGLGGGRNGYWRQVWRAGCRSTWDRDGRSPMEPGTSSGLGSITSQIR